MHAGANISFRMLSLIGILDTFGYGPELFWIRFWILLDTFWILMATSILDTQVLLDTVFFWIFLDTIAVWPAPDAHNFQKKTKN